MTKIVVFILFYTNTCLSVHSQTQLYLQHQENPSRQQKIKQKWEYTIITQDTILYGYNLVKIEGDKLVIKGDQNETVEMIYLSDIQSLKKNNKKGLFVPFGILAYTGMIMLSITPVIWATEGDEEALGTLKAAGGLLALSIPAILASEIGSKKDLKQKWKLCAY